MKTYILLFLLFIFACSNTNQFRKLTDDEIYNRASIAFFPPKNILVKDFNGEFISTDEMNKRYRRDSFAVDAYIDKSDTVRFLQVRRIQNSDLVLRKRLQNLLETNEELNLKYAKHMGLPHESLLTRTKPISINCEKASAILDTIYEKDQADERKTFNPQQDKENLLQVVSLIENCEAIKNGTASLSSMNYNTLFLVVQHSNIVEMKHYFPYFESLVEKGKLEKSTVVLMEDRILVSQKKPQKYGTQLYRDEAENKWKLSPCDDMELVKKRRKELGMMDLDEYLKRFEK